MVAFENSIQHQIGFGSGFLVFNSCDPLYYAWILQLILSVHKLLQLIMGEFGSQSHSELEGLLEAPELF